MQILLISQNISKTNQILRSNSTKKKKKNLTIPSKECKLKFHYERERELRRKFVKSESDDYIKKMFSSPNKFETDGGFVIIK